MYEGTPHGNAKLAYSEITLTLNPISFFMKVFYLHLCYIRYAARFFQILCCQSIESNQPAVVADAS